jgi:hypothetical protein
MSSYFMVYWTMSSYRTNYWITWRCVGRCQWQLTFYWTMLLYLMGYWTMPSKLKVYCIISWYLVVLLHIPWSRSVKRRDSRNIYNTHFNIFFNFLTRTAFMQSITSKIVYAFVLYLICALYTVQIIFFPYNPAMKSKKLQSVSIAFPEPSVSRYVFMYFTSAAVHRLIRVFILYSERLI